MANYIDFIIGELLINAHDFIHNILVKYDGLGIDLTTTQLWRTCPILIIGESFDRLGFLNFQSMTRWNRHLNLILIIIELERCSRIQLLFFILLSICLPRRSNLFVLLHYLFRWTRMFLKKAKALLNCSVRWSSWINWYNVLWFQRRVLLLDLSSI